jgi:hypothetical protein
MLGYFNTEDADPENPPELSMNIKERPMFPDNSSEVRILV